MNKGELVTSISERTDVSKADVERVLKAFEEIAQQIVAGGSDKLTLPGFLSIEQTSHGARTGINPQTREPLQIPAKKSAKITAGATLKQVANGDKPAPG
jgi:DNA-binding protein HU-beta